METKKKSQKRNLLTPKNPISLNVYTVRRHTPALKCTNFTFIIRLSSADLTNVSSSAHTGHPLQGAADYTM